MKLALLDSFEHERGATSAETLQVSLAWARHAEAAGIFRYWIVEHHNVAFEACPAPEVMATALAAATSRLRIGTGGILLNNYSPYKVAAQGRSLAALFGPRIDLGVGRSTSGAGPDLALQRSRTAPREDDQEAQICELAAWLSGRRGAAFGHERAGGSGAVPGSAPVDFRDMAIMPDMAAGPDLWIMAGSAHTAALAGRLGLSLACSGFHRPELVPEITRAYRAAFRPSETGPQKPRILLALMGAIAESEEEARLAFLPMRMTNERRRADGLFLPHLPSPEEALAFYGGKLPGPSPLSERFTVTSAAALRRHAEEMREAHGVDELLFRPGIAGLAAKCVMTDLLVRTLAGL